MENFLNIYRKLNAENLDLLATVYADDIRFVDPAHEIVGLDHLHRYFDSLYQNIKSIDFRFNHHIQSGRNGYVQWEMTFSHPRLKGGSNISVPGASYIQFNGSNKVNFHRDYFDLGAMLYEQLPVLGRIITIVKRRLGS
ncbi:MAG: nuclear transport factor 2 family protein [Desulfobacterales bacterium]|nr:nuclear transport factor 2 family protein [Desulfobacterales bacterium]